MKWALTPWERSWPVQWTLALESALALEALLAVEVALISEVSIGPGSGPGQ